MGILEVLILGLIYIALKETYLEVRYRMKVRTHCERFVRIEKHADRMTPQLRALLDDIRDRIENRGEGDSDRVDKMLRSAEKAVGL